MKFLSVTFFYLSPETPVRKPRTTKEKPYTGQPITIHFENTDIVDVILKMHNLNVMIE